VTKKKVKAQKKPFVAPAPVTAPEPVDMVTAKAARMALDALERVFQRLDRVDLRLTTLEGELATTLEIRNLLAERSGALAKAAECDRRVGLVLASDRALHLPGFPGTI